MSGESAEHAAFRACYRAPDASTRALWTGRDDGALPEVARWHQSVRMVDLSRDIDFCIEPTIAVIGYASDLGVARNLGRVGASEGPRAIRGRLAPLPCVKGVQVLDGGDVVGDAAAGHSVADTQEALAAAVERLVRAGALPLVLGGGHDQAFGHFLGVARGRGTAPACVNFDAHLDLRPVPADGPNSGTPYTQAWEWCRARNAAFRYIALGIQRPGNTPLLYRRAEEAGVTVVDADGFALDMLDVVMDAVNDAVDEAELCISIDLDVFAAAFAPGVSAPTAMGIAPDAAFRRVLRGLLESGRVRGVEIAELCPALDIDGRTARLAAALAFEVALALEEREEGDESDESVELPAPDDDSPGV